MNELSRRLEAVVSFVKKGEKVADIGSDHALVPISLFNRGIISEAVAIDNKPGPFKTMKASIEEAGLSESIRPSLSDGIEDIDTDTDTLILAGMGGLLIASILEKDIAKLSQIKAMIIDAHREYPYLISYLAEKNYKIVDSLFLFDKGKPYCVTRFEKSETPVFYTEEECFFGPLELTKKAPEWREHFTNVLKIDQGLLEKSLPQKKREEIFHEISMIQKALKD